MFTVNLTQDLVSCVYILSRIGKMCTEKYKGGRVGVRGGGLENRKKERKY